MEEPFVRQKNTNSIAIDFSLKMTPIVARISKPLLDFDIAIFTYCRIFEDGRRFYFCTDASWVEHYFSNNYQDELAHLEHYIPPAGVNCALWSEFNMDKIFSDLHDNFNYWHGISIYEKHDHYVDYFDFGSYRENYEMINFYFNHAVILNRFIQYFKEKIPEIISADDQNKLLIPRVWQSFDQIPRIAKKKPGESSIVTYPRSLEKKSVVYFTYIEQTLLNFLEQGKTTAEIGRILNRAPATMDCHLEYILHKTGCTDPVELLEHIRGSHMSHSN